MQQSPFQNPRSLPSGNPDIQTGDITIVGGDFPGMQTIQPEVQSVYPQQMRQQRRTLKKKPNIWAERLPADLGCYHPDYEGSLIHHLRGAGMAIIRHPIGSGKQILIGIGIFCMAIGLIVSTAFILGRGRSLQISPRKNYLTPVLNYQSLHEAQPIFPVLGDRNGSGPPSSSGIS